MIANIFSDEILSLDKKLIARAPQRKFQLPQDVQEKIDEYWESLIASGKKYRRGEVFTMANIEENEKNIIVSLEWTDYAHYVYDLKFGLPEKYACKNIHTSCLIETVDDVFVFGKMAEWTSVPGNIQCVGGGLDKDDIEGDEIDLEHNIKKELLEEAGINLEEEGLVSNLAIRYLKYSSKIYSAAAIFVLKLNTTSKEFSFRYEQFEGQLKKKNISPEFEKLVYLPMEKSKVDDFVAREKKSLDHYMSSLLKKEVLR